MLVSKPHKNSHKIIFYTESLATVISGISSFGFQCASNSKRRKYSAQIIFYSVYSEMGKHLPGAALNRNN